MPAAITILLLDLEFIIFAYSVCSTRGCCTARELRDPISEPAHRCFSTTYAIDAETQYLIDNEALSSGAPVSAYELVRTRGYPLLLNIDLVPVKRTFSEGRYRNQVFQDGRAVRQAPRDVKGPILHAHSRPRRSVDRRERTYGENLSPRRAARMNSNTRHRLTLRKHAGNRVLIWRV
jgi:hypothetical protein